MPSLHPPFAQPDPGRRATPRMATETSEASGSADFLDSLESGSPEDSAFDSMEALPSIDRFVDDLPLIDEFLLQVNAPTTVPSVFAEPRENTPSQPTGETDSEGWAAADWQSYDWSGLAALAAPEPEAAEAHAAWSSTNWDAGRAGSADRSLHLREEDVAAALDEIARRIRSGELSLQQFKGSPPEAALAAAFASLLRNKR
jgi:hypothetical protein